MKQTLTLVCKLQPTSKQLVKIEATLKAFAEACHYTNSVVKPTITNKVRIQGAVYDYIRAEFKLSANLAVRVCARVGANRKTAQLKGKPVKLFKPTSRDRFSRGRASLQSKGTKGAKRLLKRMSGRERRYQAWVNHNISRAIINQAKATGAIVAIEDLTGIRERTNQQPRNKTERRRSNSWAFYQLRQFLEYKGIQAGVEIIAVNPRYTSQTCHQCLHIGLRTAKNFKCGNCGWHGDADLNGSLMIQILGAAVSQPERSVLSCPTHGGLN